MDSTTPWKAPPGYDKNILIPCCLLCRRDINMASDVCSSVSHDLTTLVMQPPRLSVSSVHHRHSEVHSLSFLTPNAETCPTLSNANFFKCYGFMCRGDTGGVVIYNCVHTRCLAVARDCIGGDAVFDMKRVFEQTRPVLPLEIRCYRNTRTRDQNRILDVLEDEDARLRFLMGEVLGFYKRIQRASVPEIDQPLRNPNTIIPTKIRANLIPIFGELHIERIRGVFDSARSNQPTFAVLSRRSTYDNNPQGVIGGSNFKILGGNKHEIEIVQQFKVRGLQYALGSYGVAALRVVYHDELFSPWLGHFHFRRGTTYVATLQGQDLRTLQTTSDGFKMTGLSFYSPTRASTDNRVQLFWDHDQPFLDPVKVYRFHDWHSPSTHMLYNPEARLMKWLSLDNLESMTVHCSLNGFVGIRASYHGSTDPSAELECGTSINSLPMTIFLQKDVDAIEALHLMSTGTKPTDGTNQQEQAPGPYLHVRTKKGGDFYFGPHVRFHNESIIASFEIDPGQKVTGIFVDANEITSSGPSTIGVELQRFERNIETRPRSMPRYPVSHLSERGEIPERLPESTFLSKALFRQVRRLRMQKIGNRCVGLLIDTDNPPPRALGQWDSAKDYTELYNRSLSGEPLRNLDFYMSQPSSVGQSYVLAIHPNGDRNRLGRGTKRFDFRFDTEGYEIAWWFTPEYDRIERWGGSERVFPSGGSRVFRDYREGH